MTQANKVLQDQVDSTEEKEIQAEMDKMANKDQQDQKVIEDKMDKMAYKVLKDLQEQMVIQVEIINQIPSRTSLVPRLSPQLHEK